jgi:hypothetical protein
VDAIVSAIMTKRPLGSNARSKIVQTAPFPLLVETRTGIVSVVERFVVQTTATGNVTVELWSKIIAIRLV